VAIASCPLPFQQLIEGLALRRPRLSCAAVHRDVIAVAGARGWLAPSYDTVYRVIRRLGPALITLAHHEARVCSDRYDLLSRRDASRPNEMWQADHTPLDLRVLDERGWPVRPWLTIVLDDYSRVVAGYAAQPGRSLEHPDGSRIATSHLAQGDAHWSVSGIPEAFYTDHGSDFTSRTWSKWLRTCTWRRCFHRGQAARSREG
jgi:putative transposase